MDNPRELAIKAIGLVLNGPDRPKDVLESLPAGVDRRDRAFIMEVVYGVLRYRDMLDLVLSMLMKKPSGVPARTLNNLRAGMYQILFMRVPGWAAVNEAVELEGKHRGLVNGVLRNSLRKLDEIRARLAGMEKDFLSEDASVASSAIAALTSHPAWLVRRWVSRLGAEEASSLAHSNNEVPPLTLRVNTLKAERDEVISFLRHEGMACVSTQLSPQGIRLESTEPYESLGLKGLAMVQDEAAQMVSLMLDPGPGQRVLDACAAPGGKTAHMAALMKDSGEIVALDIDGNRIERLKENLKAQEVSSVRVVQADLLGYEDPGGFDRVLIDAPCSALGVIRRNPDIKYRRKHGDLTKYAETQLRLLSAGAGFLRPGGRMVFSVCSTEPEEGEMVVERFLKSYTEFYIIDEDLSIPPGMLKGGYLRTWPHRDGMDGFFAAAMERKR